MVITPQSCRQINQARTIRISSDRGKIWSTRIYSREVDVSVFTSGLTISHGFRCKSLLYLHLYLRHTTHCTFNPGGYGQSSFIRPVIYVSHIHNDALTNPSTIMNIICMANSLEFLVFHTPIERMNTLIQ